MSPGRLPSVLAGFVVFFWAFPAAPAAPAPRDPAASERQLRDLRSRIEKLQSTLDAAEQSRGEAAGLLRESDRATSEAHRALFELRQRRAALEAELSEIAGRDAKTRAALADQQALAEKLLRLQYRQGAPDRLRLVLEGRDPEQAARHLQYYGYIQRARADLIGELRKKREELAGLEADARARHEELAQNESQQAEESRRLEKAR